MCPQLAATAREATKNEPDSDADSEADDEGEKTLDDIIDKYASKVSV